jgi:hypothetical protein
VSGELWERVELPGKPGAKLLAAWDALSGEGKSVFLPHLLGETSAEWLSELLSTTETPVSASTLRTYRRSLLKGA